VTARLLAQWWLVRKKRTHSSEVCVSLGWQRLNRRAFATPSLLSLLDGSVRVQCLILVASHVQLCKSRRK